MRINIQSVKIIPKSQYYPVELKKKDGYNLNYKMKTKMSKNKLNTVLINRLFKLYLKFRTFILI